MAPSPRPWVALVALGVALVVPAALGYPLGPRWEYFVLTVRNGGYWGTWGGYELCPGKSFATGFQIKAQDDQGFWGDDTGLNGIRLFCKGGGSVTSAVGPFGTWGPVANCPPGEHLVAFTLRAEAPRGVWDDTAANDLTMRCSGGAVRDSQTFIHRGSWGGWSEPCPPSMGICGLRTRVDQSEDDIDDTGLNNVEFICCEP